MLKILRWLRGYVTFEAKGPFPERFLNLTLRADILLWDPVGEKGRLRAKTSLSDYRSLHPLAKRSGVRLHAKKRMGLPFIIHKNKKRTGLAAGVVCFFVLVQILSMFVWNIEISGLNHLSETQVRTALANQGLTTGVLKSSLDIQRLERDTTLEIGQVGWMSVNLIGSTAYVELSESYTPPEFIPKDMPCNIKASADGQILRMDIAKGAAAVKTGDGVIKGQLLVSGVVENTQGVASLQHSEAKVYAQTLHEKEITVPFQRTQELPTGNQVSRMEGRLFNIRFPLTMLFIPNENYIKQTRLDNYLLNGNGLPFSVYTENWYEYCPQEQTLTKEEAERSAYTQLALFEAFELLDTDIQDRRTAIKTTKDALILTASYTCVQDIAVKSEIGIEN